MDGTLSTYWDSTDQAAPVWIQADMGQVGLVDELMLHFWDGDSRQYGYYVEASTDGASWTEIVPPNTVNGQVTHQFDPALSMRYARVTVTSNSGPNDYAHVREIALYGSSAGTRAITYYLRQVGGAASDRSANSAVTNLFMNPTALTLADFAAATSVDGVVLHWETVSETDSLGFNL